MKDTFINDFEVKDKLTNEMFALKGIKYGKTQAGKDYVDLVLADKTGEIAGKIWDNNLPNCNIPEEGTIVTLTGDVSEFRGKQQLVINYLEPAKDFELADFLPQTKRDIEVLWKTVQKNIKKITDPNLSTLIALFFSNKKFITDFKQAAGAEKIHHAYLGGLMEHVVDMLNMAEPLAADYPEMNQSLLISGILLHDIGKMQELEITHAIIRTLPGSLAGHIGLGVIEVGEKIKQIENFPEDLKAKVLNVVLSHHGRLEYGSPVVPMTREAVAISYLDNLSAKVNTAQKVHDQNENMDQPFSDRDFALETRLYLD